MLLVFSKLALRDLRFVYRLELGALPCVLCELRKIELQM
jgi:hypothetical protein